jgi:serine/threonine-protein kinase
MISVTRVFRIGVRLAAWATPHVKEWRRQRHLNRLEGERHLGSRNWTEAEKHLTLALAEKHSAKQRVELLLGLQIAQRHQHKLTEAEQSARTAIEQAVRLKDRPLQLLALDALAEVQLEQKKYGEAETTIKEISRIESAHYRPNRARLAKCSRKLGMALLNSDRHNEALEALQEATRLSEEAFGPDHVETANSLAELGAAYRRAGDHVQAQRCLRRALELHRSKSGPNSREASDDLYHLAASLAESGDLEGAVGEYERVLAMKERQVGGNREEKAEAQVRLATLYVHAGRPAPARELLTHAIGVLERKGGEILSIALETMACADEQVGRFEDAERWREKASKLETAR